MIAPCKDCPDRQIGCHGQCERYKAFRAARDAVIEARQKNADVIGYAMDGKANFDHYKHQKRRK